MFHYFKKFIKGFTIIELLISVGIITSILSMVGVNQNQYTRIVKINDVAEHLAADIRQAQVKGSNAEEGDFDGSDIWGIPRPEAQAISVAYGVYISPTLDSSATYGSYIIYSDSKVLGYSPYNFQTGRYGSYYSQYQGSLTNCPSTSGYQKCLEKVDLPTGYKIKTICLHDTISHEECTPGTNLVYPDMEDATVFFFRPSLSANIQVTYPSNHQAYPMSMLTAADALRIVISDPYNNIKTVSVNPSGLVEVF